MFKKDCACFLFLDPQNEIDASIYFSVFLCPFVLFLYIVTLVLVFYLCPSSVGVVVTFPGTLLFPVLYSHKSFYANSCLNFFSHRSHLALTECRQTKVIITFGCWDTDSATVQVLLYSASVGGASGCSDEYGMELCRILCSLVGRLYDLASCRVANVWLPKGWTDRGKETDTSTGTGKHRIRLH
jgi:hypothetical protein